jgi:hypothetical protein
MPLRCLNVIRKGSHLSCRVIVSLNTIRVYLRNLLEIPGPEPGLDNGSTYIARCKMPSALIREICEKRLPQIAQIGAEGQDRLKDCLQWYSRNARRIIVTGGRSLLNDA